MIKGAIFDLDGTLLDSMYIWDEISYRFLAGFGKTPGEDLFDLFKTKTLEEGAQFYIDNFGIDMTVPEICGRVNGMIEEYYFETVKERSGVKDFLVSLKEKGVQMCVATVTDRYLAEAALERTGLYDFFNFIITTSETGVGKTDPYIYRTSCGRLGSAKEETLVFEDALYALECAKKDGFPCVGIREKYEKEQEKVKKASDYYLTDFEDFGKMWDFFMNHTSGKKF